MRKNLHEPVDLAAWRATRRRALLDQRTGLNKETLLRCQMAVERHIERGFPQIAGGIIGVCWPHRNEYDARPLAARLRAAGATIALPVMVGPQLPLIFREWRPESDMTELASGPLGIPYPASGPALTPGVLLLPAVGFDLAGYRLGYGGGYFDRTLAAMDKRPLVIATAHEFAKMDTLYPQPHDLPMDFVVTEAGIYRREDGALTGPTT